MLVLSRKINESIHIDGDIRIKVVAIQGKTVRLGIEAPASVGVYREEIRPASSAEVVPDLDGVASHEEAGISTSSPGGHLGVEPGPRPLRHVRGRTLAAGPSARKASRSDPEPQSRGNRPCCAAS